MVLWWEFYLVWRSGALREEKQQIWSKWPFGAEMDPQADIKRTEIRNWASSPLTMVDSFKD
jgi:hypothetical protein